MKEGSLCCTTDTGDTDGVEGLLGDDDLFGDDLIGEDNLIGEEGLTGDLLRGISFLLYCNYIFM